MKTTNILFALALLLSTFTFAQVGIGTATPAGALDVVSTNSGLVLPRVANTSVVVNPNGGGAIENGTMIFDISLNCINVYANGAWTGCIQSAATPPATFTVASPTYQGTSVINTTGIGYNGEAVPAASTITVDATVSAPGAYTLTATDATTGLVYSASGTFAAAGTQAVVLTPNAVVMPDLSSGVITMALTGADNSINLLPRIDIKSIPASATTVTDVVYGTQTWMNRNLGARRVATALNDVFSYGNHYQWGRPADGHEITVRNGTTITSGRGLADATALEALATDDTPGYANFILTNATPYDWRDDNNNNRWVTDNQGPCPTGYHVPTITEWGTADAFNGGPATASGASEGWDDNTEAYNSTLKLPSSGFLNRRYGSLYNQGSGGNYSSSTVTGIYALQLLFSGSLATTSVSSRARGFSVRCLKDD
jgi:uncharacterized protein (TIGR02145 family)